MITEAQRETINILKDETSKLSLKKLQRIYNSTVVGSERDNNCMCTPLKRKMWRIWFDKWANLNGYYD